MNHGFSHLLVRWAVMAIGVTIATKIIPGIECASGASLIVVVLLLSLFNAILRPLLLIFTLPFIVVTLGLGVFVINALLFFVVGELVDGFYVAGFWSALGGSLVVSLTNLLLGRFTRRRALIEKRAENSLPTHEAPKSAPKRPSKPGDDVIDI